MQKRVQKPELEAGDGRGAQRHGKRQQQSEHTKALFLKAAEEIFIRDGFEAAKLEEIASKAGYTRGAFYANFESKEDLFLDVAEIHIQRLVESLKQTAKSWQSHSPVRRLDALREHFMNSAKERNWTIIGLELKLFSLRHPELKTKIAALRARAFAAAVTVINE